MATLTMERRFPAPPAKVFEFITKSANLLQWWGPEGTEIRDHNLDFSRLGAWKATMVGPQGHDATVGGNVIAIDPPNYVELTLSFAMGDGQRGPESVIRFDCKDIDGETQFILTQTGLDPAHIEDMRTKGWNAAFERLEILITTNGKGKTKMAQYIIMYLGGDRFPENNNPPDPNFDPQASKAAWGAWAQELGAAAVNPGTPMMHSKIVSPNGVTDAGKQGSTGYTIVEADSMDAAIEMAKGCPYLEMGSLEVAELMQMPG